MPNQTPPAVSAENPVISALSSLFEPLAGSTLWEIKAYKDLIKESQQWMDQYFRKNENDSILQLVEGRSWLIDQILTHLWSQIEWPVPVSLIAVGGYGRGELHPYSDIDLLILSNSEIDQNLQESISRFIQFLWDIGLEVGHSVRSPQQCIELAQTDI
ncbi:MAG: nucleotidyltransferase domain-containing protein, partial [Pseudomonadales bacterium]|nr:nucleotidyltransferase domain-containing protein [Pseudomonadales bacterium]